MQKAGLWYAAALAVSLEVSAAAPARAQENKSEATVPSKPANAYRVEFVFSELQDNKIVNSRTYEMLAQAGVRAGQPPNKIRAGAHVPVLTGPSFQYFDIGMNIDCRVEDRDGGIGLNITADSSSLTFPDTDKSTPASSHPIVQQFRAEVDTTVTPGKPTIVSRMDDPSSKRRFQLEVTASKAK